MKTTAFAGRMFLLSLSLCAASAMAADTVGSYATPSTSSWFSNAGDHGALHHAGANSGFGEAVSIAKNIASDTSTWQTSSPNQNSVLLSSPGGATASLPAGALPLTAGGEKTAPHVAGKLSEFESSSMSQPGIYTMILIGVGLLALRSRRKPGQDEKFAA